VRGHLLRQLVVEAAAMEKVVDAAQEFSQERLLLHAVRRTA
jgi:hypothetical protein